MEWSLVEVLPLRFSFVCAWVNLCLAMLVLSLFASKRTCRSSSIIFNENYKITPVPAKTTIIQGKFF